MLVCESVISVFTSLVNSHSCHWTLSVLLSLQEAAELSSLKSQLQDLEVPLFAVVKENIGKELDCFKKYFSGKVYVDQQVCFGKTLTHSLKVFSETRRLT